MALVASYRSDELHRRHPLRPLLAELVRLPELERIELAPFGRVELAEHLQAIAGHRAPVVVDRILARSEGNAFFAEELVAAGAIRADIALPDALADVPGPHRGPARAGPGDPSRWPPWPAAGSATACWSRPGRPEAEVERACGDAVAGQVLVASAATESAQFRHALLQEAVYGDLLPGERTRLHATYARLLATADPDAEDGSASAAELAWHCLASHDPPRAGGAGPGGRPRRHRVRPQRGLPPPHPGPGAVEPGVPDAAAVAGVDRVEVLVRGGGGGQPLGEFRQAVGLAREAVEAIDEEAEPLRAALAYDRLEQLPARRRAGGGPDPGSRGDPGRLRAGGRAGPGGAADPAVGPGDERAGPLADGGPRLRGGPALGRGGADGGQGRRQRRRRQA